MSHHGNGGSLGAFRHSRLEGGARLHSDASLPHLPTRRWSGELLEYPDDHQRSAGPREQDRITATPPTPRPTRSLSLHGDGCCRGSPRPLWRGRSRSGNAARSARCNCSSTPKAVPACDVIGDHQPNELGPVRLLLAIPIAPPTDLRLLTNAVTTVLSLRHGGIDWPTRVGGQLLPSHRTGPH